MLSDAQCEVIKNRVNAETDIPFIREETEGKIIDVAIDTINPKLEPALRSLCPKPYVDCLKLALNENLPIVEKRHQISAILRGELETPLAQQLSGSMDVALIPEEVEEALMRQVAQKIIEEFVEWTVGEIGDLLPPRLQETRIAADSDAPPAAEQTGNKNDCSIM